MTTPTPQETPLEVPARIKVSPGLLDFIKNVSKVAGEMPVGTDGRPLLIMLGLAVEVDEELPDFIYAFVREDGSEIKRGGCLEQPA